LRFDEKTLPPGCGHDQKNLKRPGAACLFKIEHPSKGTLRLFEKDRADAINAPAHLLLA